ncbi:cyclase family protein [Holophaga foetida]|uniref:cyclase family protein n=1 Tax=Holophaga foetida TaxID=35839 RepID=UPI0002471CC1|nr:cyclase family protein [Holophaga foetida]
MRVIDLSHPIQPGMPLFPGTPGPRLEPLASLEREGYVEQWMGMASHTGTHIDAPAHLLPGGRGLEAFPAGHFVGPGLVIPVRSETLIRLEDLAPYEARIRESRFLLLHTGWDARWGAPSYFEAFPILETAAAEWLASFDLAGIGIDAPSLDPVDSQSLPNHRAFLSRGTCLIENLRSLGAIGPEPFLFSCLPLPFRETDGCPVRAVAMRPAP